MNITEELKEKLKSVFQDTLEAMADISGKAKEQESQPGRVEDLILGTNSLVDGINISTLYSTSDAIKLYKDEPFISRVEVIANGNERELYYFNKIGAPHGVERENSFISSYKSPIGRLAAQNIGDLLTINGTNYKIVSSISVEPIKKIIGWDSYDTVLKENPLLSFSSLLDFIHGYETEILDNIEDILRSTPDEIIREGINKDIIGRLSLRLRPILDKFQDEIFRLPINSQLIIVGPPGTGKTTTLIKRISQKIDFEGLTDSEKNLVKNPKDHQNSWIMFTPNDLLKGYLKEAFNKENIPASNERLKTWDEYSMYLGRDIMGILKDSGASRLIFSKKEISNEKADFIEWYESFKEYYFTAFAENIRTSLVWSEQKLRNSLFVGLTNALNSIILNDISKLPNLIFNIEESSEKINEIFIASKDDIDEKQIISSLLIKSFRSNKLFFEELYSQYELFKKQPANEDDDEETEEEQPEERDNVRIKAKKIYENAIYALARSKVRKKTIPKKSIMGKLLEWLGDRTPTEEELLVIGTKLITKGHRTTLTNSLNRIVNEIPKYYLRYRAVDENKIFYVNKSPNEIDQFELDIIILLRLQLTLYYRNLLREEKKSSFKWILDIEKIFKNQVYVDEVTDFSAIQLNSIKLISNPIFQSVFVSGDFNQRLTVAGLKNEKELKWVSQDFSIRKIDTIYRQSKLLNDFSKRIVDSSLSKLEDIDQSIDIKPVLAENLKDTKNLSKWLLDRISEIKIRTNDQLPSIAILVNNDEEVREMEESLIAGANGQYNVRIIGSTGGRDIAEDYDIRIFSVKYIKGLEFESVFYINVDELKTLHPDLFDKYLYVGSTRAATFLGYTCKEKLPTELEHLRSYFCENWR